MSKKSPVAHLPILLSLSGCSMAPSRDILGSYFPSWMLSAVIGLLLTIALHIVFVKSGVEEFIPAKPAIYPLLTAALTFLIWLIWFGN